jgi:D-glycero-alpha-D-manno-heptose-7-phosphate kinase
MKESILKGDFIGLANNLRMGWEAKKRMADVISNKKIDDIYNLIMNNGAYAAKISGAGGGGYMMILCNPNKRTQLINLLENTGDGKTVLCEFTDSGTQGWTIY